MCCGITGRVGLVGGSGWEGWKGGRDVVGKVVAGRRREGKGGG